MELKLTREQIVEREQELKAVEHTYKEAKRRYAEARYQLELDKLGLTPNASIVTEASRGRNKLFLIIPLDQEGIANSMGLILRGREIKQDGSLGKRIMNIYRIGSVVGHNSNLPFDHVAQD